MLHVERSNDKRSLFWRPFRERENRGKAEAWGYANHQESLSTRLAPLTKALGFPEGNLRALAEK